MDVDGKRLRALNERDNSPNAAPQPPAEPDLQATDSLAEASVRLLRTAEGIVRDTSPRPLSEFAQVYKEWITLERGELGTQQEQADQWQMLVHCMVNAATINDAIAQLLRFSPVVWRARALTELRDEGDLVALLFNEPFRPGPEGLVAAIWMLSLILTTLEFLGNVRFLGVSGRVVHEDCLPDGVARLLLDAPLGYGQDEVALLIPRHHLRRPVVVRASDLTRFFRQVLPLTLGEVRSIPDMRTMVAGLIRDRKQGPDFLEISRSKVASMLGVSEATMRRRLGSEGGTYRQVKEEVYNALALEWLENTKVPVGAVAARLGFSDTFAFRRFFVRRNGFPPSKLRGNAGVGKTAKLG